jgi:lipoprotein-anchoring transpeptidase ErfK/SrfK
MKITRRSLLKLSGAAAIGAPLFYTATPTYALNLHVESRPPKRPFGRVIQGNLAVREAPSVKAKEVRRLKRNEVIDVLAEANSEESPTAYNTLWYQTSDGWVYSAQVQPSENVADNPALPAIDKEGVIWGELTVPLSPARAQPNAEARAPWTHYYGTTHQLLEVVSGADGAPWYRISDGILSNLHVPAAHIRVIQPDEFTAISPEIPLERKRIDVDLKAQTISAFEDDVQVFSARCATGAAFRQADGTVRSFRTIPGDHRVYLKTPSQRMYGGAGDGDSYDLPGIAWISYFTASGIAFHSTYWHNDYGKPRSHGCVNLLPEDAKWVYRWTMPATPYEQRWTRAAKRDEGTLVRVA